MAHLIANAHDDQEMLWTGSNVTISSGKRTREWALTFFPRTLFPRLLLCDTDSLVFFSRYPLCTSQIQLCPFPRDPPSGAFAYLVSESWEWGISKFCGVLGSGICLGSPPSQFWHARGFLSSNITKYGGFYWKHKQIGRSAHLSRTQKIYRGF